MTEKKKRLSPVRLITYTVLSITAIVFVLYVLADRFTPYTEEARIDGISVPISPRVSGYLTEIRVRLHTKVSVGDTLFQLDRRPFELDVASKEAHVDNTAQMVSARTASVKSAAGRLGVARAQLDRAQRNWDRVQVIINDNPGALSQSDKDQAETSLTQAVEQVASAEADLERSQQQLGVSGDENPQFRAAVTSLENAQLNLAFSTVIATAPGVIESFNLDIGYYAQAGQPLTTLISKNDIWIQANLKENNLSHLKIGDKIEFALDVHPGEVYTGTVRSIGFGVSTSTKNKGELPSIKGSSGWLRDPQRFPVIIAVDDDVSKDLIRIGGQVDVVAYTSDRGFLNMLARWRIRVNSWLSYLR